MKRLTSLFSAFLLSITAVYLTSVSAEPFSDSILVVSGVYSDQETTDEVTVSREFLKSLPTQQISTRTPWEEGVHTYTGFNPVDLIEKLNLSGNLLRISALNQYITEIPLGDFSNRDAIIAYEIDDRTISVRNKGPLMVVYNFDNKSHLRTETHYGRSIWQIKSIEVIDTKE